MVYLVYYRADMMNSYLITAADIDKRAAQDDYNHVATVDIHESPTAECLERLFRIMNCVDGGADEIVGGGMHSTNIPQVRVRSFSVGDIVIEADHGPIDNQWGETMRGYLCEASGWKSFTDTSHFNKRFWPIFYDGLPKF